jgi:hypothetical protein
MRGLAPAFRGLKKADSTPLCSRAPPFQPHQSDGKLPQIISVWAYRKLPGAPEYIRYLLSQWRKIPLCQLFHGQLTSRAESRPF